MSQALEEAQQVRVVASKVVDEAKKVQEETGAVIIGQATG